MKLTSPEATQFFATMRPLLNWVNQTRSVVPTGKPQSWNDPLPIAAAIATRDVLWADDALLEAFVTTNPAALEPALLDLAWSWRHREFGNFTVWKHYQKHTIFLGAKNRAYAVLGLTDPLRDLIPEPPKYVKTALLPFGDRIVTDGLIAGYHISLGPGIRGDLSALWKDISERRDVITSLLPMSPAEAHAQAASDRAGTNKDVLRAFSRHLRELGLSDRVTARDENTAETLAAALPDRSVRDCALEDLEALLAAAPPAARAELRTGLLRFVQFLRDTNRMDWEEADETRRALRAR